MQKKSLGFPPSNAGYEQKIGSIDVSLTPSGKPESSWGGHTKLLGGVLVGVFVLVAVGVLVGVLVGVVVGVTGWLPYSNAPLSQRPFAGRGAPR